MKKTDLTFKFAQKDLNYLSQLLHLHYKDASNNVIRFSLRSILFNINNFTHLVIFYNNKYKLQF